MVEAAPTDELPVLAKDDRKVVLRSVPEALLASTDELPSIVNRVTRWQMDRSSHLSVSKGSCDGQGVRRLRDAKEQTAADDRKP